MDNITQLIQQNDSIIVYAGQEKPEDSFPAALAVCGVAQAHNKQAFLFSCVPIPQRLHFLPFNSMVSPNNPFVQNSSFYITTQHDVSNIHYTRQDRQFYVTLENNDGVIPLKDITIQSPPHQHKCVIAIGCTEQEIHQLTQTYSIDPQSITKIQKNDLEEQNTPSYCELLAQIFKMDVHISVTAEIATILLAGVVLSTNNFQRKGVKPQTLFCAAYLIAQNADKEYVIQNLYKARSLSFMQAWGIVLKRVTKDLNRRLCWSYVTQQELNAHKIQPHEIHLLLEELQNISRPCAAVILGVQKQNTIFCFCATEKQIASHFNATQHKEIFVVPVRARKNIDVTLQLLAHNIYSYL